MGPCRIDPFGEGPQVGVCGATADLIVATAAVSDWRPETSSPQKTKKGEGDLDVHMVRTPDVLAAIGREKRSGIVVGFAAETENHETNAREKMARKRLDAIAVNDVAGGRGFFLRVERKLVLIFSRHAELFRDVLGRLSHRVDAVGVAHFRIYEAPSDARVEELRVARKGLSGF